VGALLMATGAATAKGRKRWLVAALIFGLAPELSYQARFTSRSPVEQWRKLAAGGPEQQRVLQALAGGRRLGETSPGRFELLFPGVLAHLYSAHVAHGYSSFPLPDIGEKWKRRFPKLPWVDAQYVSNARGLSAGRLTTDTPPGVTARFQWEGPSARPVRMVSETLNTVTVHVDDGAPGVLWRTDRYYPGWQLNSKLASHVEDGSFLVVNVPAGAQSVEFRYEPTWATPCRWIAGGALAACLLVVMAGPKRNQA